LSDHVKWLAALSPWPEEFGLARIRELLAALGNPERRFPAVHVVGSKGKSTTVRMIEALLAADGLAVGAYTSPHVRGWSERIRVRQSDADLDAALARVRPDAEALGATQFEVLTAAAFAEFADTEVNVAVVEAGLGGRLDATNVLETKVVVLTNVSLEHTDVLGSTREQIAAEKLAVARPGCTVVLGEPEWEGLARANGAATVTVVSRSNLALAVAAAEAFLGRVVDASPAAEVTLPGRLEYRSEHPLELWDGAHSLDGVGYLLPRLPDRRFVLVVSILGDKDADGMLAALAAVGDTLIATRSSNPRALSATELAARAAERFTSVETVEDPLRALERGRELAGQEGAVLVTGSLYLLADLSQAVPA
jgi:dihydrofolate synthase/folylpolyglutamate synthase